MTRKLVFVSVAVVALTLIGSAHFSETLYASRYDDDTMATPIVFQAAGPTVASIQSMVDAFRAAIGGANNGNGAGPLTGGRREINWDGGGSTDTSPVPTPFDGFLVNRGARFTTRGTGFVQAPVGGLATTFDNPAYSKIFQAFSPVRLFSPVGSNVTVGRFFIPGGGELPATTRAFGAVFTDVDQSGGRDARHGYDRRDNRRRDTTSIWFYGVHGRLLFKSDVPASAGDASLSFLGVLYDESRIAYVRITTGNVDPGRNADLRGDAVVMDDFVYAEPQIVEDPLAVQDLQSVEVD